MVDMHDRCGALYLDFLTSFGSPVVTDGHPGHKPSAYDLDGRSWINLPAGREFVCVSRSAQYY